MTDPRQQSAQPVAWRYRWPSRSGGYSEWQFSATPLDLHEFKGWQCEALFAAQPPQGETREPTARALMLAITEVFPVHTINAITKRAIELRDHPLAAERPQESPEPCPWCGSSLKPSLSCYRDGCGWRERVSTAAPDAGKLSLSSPDETPPDHEGFLEARAGGLRHVREQMETRRDYLEKLRNGQEEM